MTRVFCDMDGVVVDFEGGYSQFAGAVPANTWRDITRADWLKLQKEWPTFWADLDYAPHALDLWRVLQKYTPSILTAIPKNWPSAAVGKTIWVKRKLPGFGQSAQQRVIACMREEKRKYAKLPTGEPCVLIDDLERNIREWEAAGGIGVHYLPSSSAVRRVAHTLEQVIY